MIDYKKVIKLVCDEWNNIRDDMYRTRDQL